MSLLESKYLYLLLLVLSVSFPLTFSWDKRFSFAKKWYRVFAGCAVMMLIFIPWDIWFAKEGVWWFNHKYTLGLDIFLLPIEEWLFFVIIPFSCLFIYESVNYFIPELMPAKGTKWLSIAFLICCLVLAFIHQERLYTLIVCIYTAILLAVAIIKKYSWMNTFMLMYLISWLPFLLVNGALTGWFTTEALVNYDPNNFMGIRLFTIPIEDSIYSLGMLLTVCWVYEAMKPQKEILKPWQALETHSFECVQIGLKQKSPAQGA